MLRITGRRLPSEPATLEGFARSMLRGEAYPGIAPAAGARTPGTLYSGLDPESLALLDRFESDLYERRSRRARRSSAEAPERCARVQGREREHDEHPREAPAER